MLPLTKKDKNSRKYTSTSFPFPNEQISQQTWPIKYKPKLSQDLALHNSKIKVIQQWLNKSIEDKSEPVGFDGHPRVLIVSGNSGCGKSTAVEILCQDLNISIKEWSEDSFISETSHFIRSSFNYYDQATHISRLNRDDSYNHPLFGSTRYKKEEQVQDFVLQSAYPTLSLQSKSCTKTPRQSCVAGKKPKTAPYKNILSKDLMYSTHVESNMATNVNRQIALIHDPPILTNYNTNYKSNYESNQSVILDGDLIARMIDSLDVPVVIILSNVTGKEGFSYSLEQLIPTRFRSRMALTCVHCNEVTCRVIEKTLTNIAVCEGLSKNSSIQKIIQGIAETSHGDLRHAINQFELVASTLVSNPKHSPIVHPLSDGSDVNNNGSVFQSVSRNRSEPIFNSREVIVLDDTGNLCSTQVQSNISRVNYKSIKTKRHAIYVEGDEGEGTDKKFSWPSQLDTTKIMNISGSIKPAKKRCTKFIDSDSETLEHDNHNDSSKGVVANHSHISDTAKHLSKTSYDYNHSNHLDEKYSFLHGVAKLLHQNLDKAGKPSFDSDNVFTCVELDQDLLVDFMQFNSIAVLMNSHRLESGAVVTQSQQLALDPTLETFVQPMDELDQAVMALSYFSDVSILSHRRFDTSNQLDRSQTFFPDKYVIGIASRIGSVSKGTGAKERIEMGKKNGIRAVFQGIYRPKILSIRKTQNMIKPRLRSLRNELSKTVDDTICTVDEKSSEQYAVDKILNSTPGSNMITKANRYVGMVSSDEIHTVFFPLLKSLLSSGYAGLMRNNRLRLAIENLIPTGINSQQHKIILIHNGFSESSMTLEGDTMLTGDLCDEDIEDDI